jgi:hypothetical protein
MKKITVCVACVSLIAVLWLCCSGSQAREFVSLTDRELDFRPVAAPGEMVGARIPHNDSMSRATTAADIATQAVLTQPDVNSAQIPLKSAGRFDHLVADTLPEDAMAPPKSDAAEAGATRRR